METYNLKYEYNGIQGFAVVRATSEHKAIRLLKSSGKFNGTPAVYNIVDIKTICTNCSGNERIISELYNSVFTTTVKETVVKEIPIEVDKEIYIKEPLDVNNLSKEQIEALKLRINQTTGTLYVDKIGGFSTVEKKYPKGFTLLVVNNNQKTTANTHHIYYYNGSEFIDMGKPTKYRYVESQNKLFPCSDLHPVLDGGPHKSYLKPEYFRYGIFFYRKTNRKNPKKRWVLLDIEPIHHQISYSEFLTLVRDHLNRNHGSLKCKSGKTYTYYPQIFKIGNGTELIYWTIFAFGRVSKKGARLKSWITLKGDTHDSYRNPEMIGEPIHTYKDYILQ